MKLERKTVGSLVLRGLTPLLDTLFLLLFALLAVSETRDVAAVEEVRIQLPAVEAGNDATEAPVELLSILVDADSVVRLAEPEGDGTRIGSFEELDAALARRLGARLPEDVAIDIVADEEARHGVMVEILQHLRLRGFLRVQLLATGAGTGSAFRGDER